MTQQTSPFLEGKFGWALGESNWNLGMDENLLKFSYMFDKNIDGIVSSLPAAVNGQAYFNTTDNRIYFAVGGSYTSTPTPKWFIFTLRTTGIPYQFDGTSLTTNVVNLVDDKIPALVSSFTEIRAIDKVGGPKFVFFPSVGGYYLDASDTTSANNNGMIIVATDGGRWKLLSHTASSAQIYQEFGAVVERSADRFFAGDAAKNNGKNETIQADWLTTYQIAKGRSNGFIQSCQAAILTAQNTDVSNCLVVASKTSNLYDNYNSIGFIGMAVADKTTGTGHAYAGYFEAYREVGVSGGAYAIEVDTINYSSYVAIDPYLQLAGQTIGFQLASGGEYSSVGQFDASAGLNIRKNGAKFGIGLIFGSDSIAGTDGTGTGTGVAIALARGHLQQWYSSTGNKTCSILGDCATPALSLAQSFVDNQVRWRNVAGKNVLQVSAVASSVNFLSLRSSITATPVVVAAGGDDANIDIQLLPQGTGLVSYGTYTASAVAQTGYISVRDAGGTIRRLLVG